MSASQLLFVPARAYICKYATKCTRQRRGAKEQRDAIVLLLSFIPHRQVEDNPGKEAALGHAQKEAGGEEARHILCHTK